MSGGSSTGGSGGFVSFSSGLSSVTSSGAVVIESQNAGTTGTSGSLQFRTGTSSSGASGKIAIATGVAKAAGEGGAIKMAVEGLNGGDILMSAGSPSTTSTGGFVSLTTAASSISSSGQILVTTHDAGTSGVMEHSCSAVAALARDHLVSSASSAVMLRVEARVHLLSKEVPLPAHVVVTSQPRVGLELPEAEVVFH